MAIIRYTRPKLSKSVKTYIIYSMNSALLGMNTIFLDAPSEQFVRDNLRGILSVVAGFDLAKCDEIISDYMLVGTVGGQFRITQDKNGNIIVKDLCSPDKEVKIIKNSIRKC